MPDLQPLYQRAAMIRDAVLKWENTANRVGSLFYDILSQIQTIDTGLSEKYLRKDIPDSAKEKITFEKGLQIGPAFAPGYTGTGGHIDEKGNAELESLILRDFLETPELRKNRIRVNGNETWYTDVCIVKSVEQIAGTNHYIILPKLDEGELLSFQSSDVLRGIFSYDTGFSTSILQVITVSADLMSMRVATLNNRPPMPYMVLARKTNAADTDRQGSIYADGLNKYIRVLNGYNPDDPGGFDIDQIKVQLGDLSQLNHPAFGQLSGYGLFAQRVFLIGQIMQMSYDGTEYQRPNYWRGEYSPLKMYAPGDLVRWYKPLEGWGTYRCVEHTTPGITPENVFYWELFIPAGSPAYVAEIYSTNGTHFLNGNVDTTLHVILKMGSEDVTASVSDTDITWTRSTSDAVSDQAWNNAHLSAGKYLNINSSDLIGNKAVINVEINTI